MKISNLYPWIRSGTRYALPNDFTFSDIAALKVPSMPPFYRRYLYSFVYLGAYPTRIYIIYLRTDPQLPASTEALKIGFPRASWTRILQLVGEVDRISRASTRRSPRPFHRNLSTGFGFVFFFFCVCPFLPPSLRILTVSNLYRRCRTPPATGQIIHYGARACTRHVARGEARLREAGKRCGGRTGGSQTLLSSAETSRERKKRAYEEVCVCICTCLWRSS